LRDRSAAHREAKCRSRAAFCEVVDALPENWNQLESYAFEAYELIKNANLGNNSKELVAT